MKRIALGFIVSTMLLTSCEKMFFEEELFTKDPRKNFDYLWGQCDENYSYFKLKGVDWNSIYTEYSSKVFEDMSDDSLFSVLAALLSELDDGHVNLFSDFNVSFNYVIYTGQDNYDRRIVFDNYTSSDEYTTGPFKHSFLADKRIGYIRLDRFGNEIDENNLNFVLGRYRDTEGLILDIRENRGGSPSDVFKILSKFVQDRTLAYYTRIKKPGTDQNAFEEAVPVYLEPSSTLNYLNKVIVLIDRETYSAGSFLSLATKAIDNVVLMGDTTGGGLGAPNGGQLPNGWTYRFSITQALTLDGSPDYENGVPPDIFAAFDWNDRTKDEIIEKAINEILE